MLAADKLLLQSNVKQRAIQLREKELNLFNDKRAPPHTDTHRHCSDSTPSAEPRCHRRLRCLIPSSTAAASSLSPPPSLLAPAAPGPPPPQLQRGGYPVRRPRWLRHDQLCRDRPPPQRVLCDKGAAKLSCGHRGHTTQGLRAWRWAARLRDCGTAELRDCRTVAWLAAGLLTLVLWDCGTAGLRGGWLRAW